MTREKIIGIALNPQEDSWIEKWGHENRTEVDLIEKRAAFMVRATGFNEYLKDAGILDQPIDGIVVDTFRLDDDIVQELHELLQAHELKLYSARGETSRQSWRIR